MKAYRLRKNLKINKIESFGVATVMESLPSLLDEWKKVNPSVGFDFFISDTCQQFEGILSGQLHYKKCKLLKRRIMKLYIVGCKALLRMWEDSGATETFDVFLFSRYTKTKTP